MRQTLNLIAACCLVVTLASAAAADGPAYLVQAQGAVEATSPSGPLVVKIPLEVPEGTTIRTGGGGSALLMMGDGSKVQIRPDSSFTYEKSAASETAFSLLKGAITLWVRHQTSHRVNVRTPTAVASVRGTIFDAVTDGRKSHFDLYQGEIAVSDSFGKMTIITPGQRAVVDSAHGLSGTSSLPAGTGTPAEPVATLPKELVKTEAAKTEKKEEKKKEVAKTIPSEPAPAAPPATTPPPPPPKQQAAVVSPSAP